MEIKITVTDAQQDALRLMNVDNPEELAENSFGNVVRGRLKYYRNGSKIKDEFGNETYKGGLKQGAVAAFQMARKFLPKDVTEAMFVADALKEVDDVIARISAKETTSDNEE